MKKFLRICIFVILTVLIIGMSVFAYKSDIWQQNFVVDNMKSWNKLNDGWSIQEDRGGNINGSITISRIFYTDDVHELLGKEVEKSKPLLSAKEATNSDWPVLFFLTHNQNVCVFVDNGSGDKLVYSFGNNGTQYIGSESGNAIHCVSLPHVGQENVTVTVQLYPSFDSTNLRINNFFTKNMKAHVPDFYFGWRSMCISTYLRNSIIQAIPILLMYMMGLFALFVWFVSLVLKKLKLNQYLYWGIFTIDCATGFFFESYLGYFLTQNSYLLYFLSTILIALHPRLFLIYIQEKLEIAYNDNMVHLFRHLPIFNILLICAASYCPYTPFSLIRYYVCAVLVLFIIFMVYTIIHYTLTINSKMDLLNKAIIFAAACIVLDLIIALFNHTRTDIFFFSRFGMLIFYIICAVLITNEAYDDQMLKERSRMLEKAAYTDILTGCRNAAALWRDNKKLNREKNGFAMGVVHIVNIAEITSAEGSAVGDNALWSIAQILFTIFSKETVYRLSGTKFCILLPNDEIDNLNTKMEDVKSAVEAYNKKNTSTSIKIAVATGVFSPSNDFDFDGTFVRLVTLVRDSGIQMNRQ